MASWSGYYWTDQVNYYRHISFSGDSLFWDSGNPDYKSYLVPIGHGEFRLSGFEPEARVIFGESAGEADMKVYFGSLERNFRRFDPAPPQGVKDLGPILGTYYSEELDTEYQIEQIGDTVYWEIDRKASYPIFPLAANSRMVWNGSQMIWVGIGELKFDVASDNKVQGLSIGDQRVSGIYFKKLLEN